jgi:hypothetical protein
MMEHNRRNMESNLSTMTSEPESPEWIDRWPHGESSGRVGVARRATFPSAEGVLTVSTRQAGYLDSAARMILFGSAREGWIRWTSNRRTGAWGIRSVERDEGYHVDRKGRMNVRALTDELNAGAWPVRFRLARDPINPSRLLFAGVVE